MHPEALKDLARRIEERAAAGKEVRLIPATAMLVARILDARATRPMRPGECIHW